EHVLAFSDLKPEAPTHVLVIPRRHVSSLAEVGAGDGELLGRLLLAAAEVARREGVDDGGYRLVLNTGRDAGQLVMHLHFHVLGGRGLGWPPG
ncbi:MAG: HIT domain-containing protein, partial [Deltaproteobacteria bacterium]|nr:HIT domain-containing protein [Deltaproteobacteria bacterium]